MGRHTVSLKNQLRRYIDIPGRRIDLQMKRAESAII